MIPHPEIAAELARELAARRAAYPRQVERLQMTQAQADTELALCAAWGADHARYAAVLTATPPIAPIAPVALSGGFTWAQRRGALRQELDRRAQHYPRWIAQGKLDQAEATRRVTRLSAMADLYDEGHDWHDSFGTRPPFGPRFYAPDHTAPEAEALRQWWTHVHQTLATRHGSPIQEQLAL
ncbi:hypothetical protein [Novosphingobium sp. FSW06-99]|uniref:hypothetical protein n=1 Tax=Novosphingobium sp. FSW06-99 TaxID=1739113 RepID=UPI00076BC13F|nr:hypothetical protein [Novosphingobium sp. FSW06-99]KUR80942.1 hypothetical protein AQZ49_02650 [Novosphingobium sp. FSW06-99]